MSYEICEEPGPCWENYVYIGPEPGKKGSCVKKKTLCNKKKGKGIGCKKKINCKINVANNIKINKDAYIKCLSDAEVRYNNKKLKLCPRGYCTAKQTFDVYPSAYANGYGASVCKGKKPDALGKTKVDNSYINNFKGSRKKNSLNRWYNEEWVNVCEKGDGPGGFAKCGTGKGLDNPEKYPYCRAYYKLPGTKVVTAPELTKEEINSMCKHKRSLEQGIDGKPTRIYLSKKTKDRVKSTRQKGGNTEISIPIDVKNAAAIGNKLIDKGFSGGTQTGWDRGLQLESDAIISLKDLADMRTWFARHGPDARNGGTSYPGYCKWLANGRPTQGDKNKYRGAVSWLIWGGNPAYKWLKTPEISNLLIDTFPNRKKASPKNFLGC